VLGTGSQLWDLLWLIPVAAALAAVAVGVWIGRRRRRIRSAGPEADAAPECWHRLAADQVFAELNSSPEGLGADEVHLRLVRFGPNQLPEAQARSPLVRLLLQFHNVLIYVLLIAGAVTAVLQHWLDAGVIFGVVLINAAIGFIQEGKAEDALRAIRRMLSPRAMVLRDGRRVNLDAKQLVPGDVVPLQSGDKVPADLRLFRLKGLQIDEAALTGESVPVDKNTDPAPCDAVIGDRSCMAYSGTLVTHGQASGVVVATGAATEIGRISALVAGVQRTTTPLLKQMARFGRWLTGAILLLAGAGFAFGVLLRDYTASQMFLASVGLAVAAIPEGLPAIMTITLAIGVKRMAARNAIIRRLPAVETLGTVGVICSDKTGTLTCNEMTVRSIHCGGRRIELSGTGYHTHGGFQLAGKDHPPRDDPVLKQALLAALLCNDTTLERCVAVPEQPCEGEWRVQGDPMEGALVIAAMKAGLDPGEEAKRHPRTDLIPFESEHKFMATLHHSHTGEARIFVKGAPERLLEMCNGQLGLSGKEPLDAALWHVRMEELATAGQRVLAVAAKPGLSHQRDLEFADVESGLVLLGLFGLIDPPRLESPVAVRACRNAGIRVKMITGDHGVTARAIAQRVGLQAPEQVLSGQELDAMDDAELRQRVEEVDVYARVSPEHKLRLVSRLQEAGHIVAMTGDGVNDAPALKRADVGVAMGNKGTEVAKDASEMVLADDNFASIAYAVQEGRTVDDNIRKSILFILPTNGGEAMVMLGAVLLGFQQFPLTPVQILWVNMITAVTLALALAFEPTEDHVMARPPRDPDEPLLTSLFLWRIGYVSLILMCGTFGLFLWETAAGAEIERARTIAVNTLVMFEIFYLFSSRYITAPVINRSGLLGNRYVLVAVALLLLFQLAFTYLGPLQTLFGTTGIEAMDWGRIVLVASSVLWLVELEKVWYRRRVGKTVDAG